MWPFRRRSIRGEPDERLRLYVARELCARLGVPPADAARASIRAFAEGRFSYVRCVELPSFGRLVVRLAWRQDRVTLLASLPHLAGLLGERGVLTPRVLFLDDSRPTWRAYGFALLAEEFVEGALLGQVPAEVRRGALPQVACALARFHSIRSPVAGRPWERVGWEPGRQAQGKAARDLRRLRLEGILPSRRRERELAAWLAAQVRSLAVTEFPLVHHDFAGSNLILRPDGQLCVIDFAGASHWFPQVDLLTVESELCGPDSADAEGFHRAYFGAPVAPAVSWEQCRASRPLFRAWRQVGVAVWYARNARGARGPEARAEQEAQARDAWAEAERLLALAGAP